MILSVCFCQFMVRAQSSAPQYTNNTPEQVLRGSARINPSTLAMEFSLPFGAYPGRNGSSIPVGLNYSSKIWRMDNGSFLDPVTHITTRATQGVYSDHSMGGWSHTLQVPTLDLSMLTWSFSPNGDPSGSDPCMNNTDSCYPPTPTPTPSPTPTPNPNGGGASCDIHFNGHWYHCSSCDDYYGYNCDLTSFSNQVTYTIGRIFVHFPDGSTTELRSSDTPVTNFNANTSYYSIDGSNMRLDFSDTSKILYLPNGSRYIWNTDSSGRLLVQYVDENGNIVTYHQTGDIQPTTGAMNSELTDTVGRTLAGVLPGQPTANTDQTYSLPGLNGGQLNYTLKWRSLGDVLATGSSLKYIGNEDSCTTAASSTSPSLFTSGIVCGASALFNPVVLAEVDLPNGTSYKFNYNSNAEITKITYPTGAYERFQYEHVAALSQATSRYSQTNRGVIDRWVSVDGSGNDESNHHTHYSAGYDNGVIGVYDLVTHPYRVVTTAPDGTKTENRIYAEQRDQPTLFRLDNILIGKSYDERAFDANGNMVRRKLTQWVGGSAGSGNHGGGPWGGGNQNLVSSSNMTYPIRDPHVLRTVSMVYETNGSSALAQSQSFTYDQHLNVISSGNYDFVVLSNSNFQTLAIENVATGTILKTVETDYVTDSNYISRQMVSMPTSVRMRDGGSSGTVISETQTVYDNAVPSSNSGYNYSVLSYGTGNSFDCSSNSTPKICWQNPNGSSGNIDLSYRGKPTTTRVWNKDTNTWIESHIRYDQFGNAVAAKDPIGNETTTQFVDTTSQPYRYAYPVSITTPAPDPTATHGTDQTSTASTTYDANTGLPLTVTDDFNQTTQTEYNDPLLRPTRVYAVNFTAPETQTVYDDTNLTVKVRKQIDSSNWDEATTYMDALGRAVKTQAKDSQGDVFVDTHYDNMGRVDRVTNPYRTGDTVLWSKTRFDELGRAVETFAPATYSAVTASDNSGLTSLGVTSFGISTVTDYVGTAVISTDASGRKSRSITNALGQLIRVDEPTGVSSSADTDLGAIGSPNQATYYTYSPQGKMVKVTQGVQSRYFQYDSLGRLLRVNQPEQEYRSALDASDTYNTSGHWTAGFVYDVLGNVLRATDANGVNIINEYDRANRVTKRCYTKPNVNTSATNCASIATNDQSTDTQMVNFWYDGRGLASTQSPNFGKGKLTKVDNGVSATLYSQFDNLGRLTQSSQLTDGNTYTSSYQYNFVGEMIQETYPSGRVVNNEFELHGDLAKVTSKKAGSSVNIPYVSDFAYTASGGISQMKLGNGKWETAKFNNRLQVTELGLGASATDASTWKVNYEYGELDGSGNTDTTKNTGNISKQTLTVPGASFVQSYNYDSLNRLTKAVEKTGTTQNWIQNWGYDRYGNRSGYSQNIAGSTTAPNPTVDQNTNRFVANQGFVYDKNGNVTSDIDSVTNQSRTFVFNGDNKQTQVKDVNGIPVGTYYYDGEGKRVKKVTNTETTIFVYSAGKLAAEYSTQLSQNPMVSYTTTDHLGSPRIVTDQFGQVKTRRDFMPFGEEIHANVGLRTNALSYDASSSDNVRQKFTGYQKDTETSLDFAEARMYENRYGRFTAIDPLLSSGRSAKPQTFNRYAYALNNPIVLIDDNGEFPFYFYLRSFAPYDWFGGFFGHDFFKGDGDNRRFSYSLDPDVTSRIMSYTSVETTLINHWFSTSD